MSYQSSSGATGSVPNSNMAVVSLVFGILGLTFLPTLGSIVALITGYLARKEIGQSAGALGGEGLATAGIVLGWIGVGLGVIGLCVAGFFIAIPLCLVPLGIWSSQSTWLLPGSLLLVF